LKTSFKIFLTLSLVPLLTFCGSEAKKRYSSPAQEVISRVAGTEIAARFEFSIDSQYRPQGYSLTVRKNKVYIAASDQVSLCRGAYDYLSNACNSLVSWSGNRINIPDPFPVYSATVQSPYRYHFYFNVVTHGYTTPYWDWGRWEKEIDWMALHGINMPCLPGAHEAILLRVFKKTGLSPECINDYFSGPAYFPWNRMGNLSGWDGPPPESFFASQVALTHKILDRLHQLDMHPIIPAFAGFVPQGIRELFPTEKVRELAWGGFDRKYQANILEPGSDLFIRIGKMYIKEWEAEFGRSDFYMADSFNEMDVPLSADSVTALKELAGYGESVYRSIEEGNPDATWVMQGWTFPYQQKDGKLFWTPERLRALVSKVPDNKLLILDLANEYNRLWWKSEPSWKMYDGFFGKQWIYSFIPNMGGKTSMNGRLDLYAQMPYEVLNYEGKGNLTGFGFAPEGIENNEIIYELLSDVGWSASEINLPGWIEKYCTRRYGSFPEEMKQAFDCFQKSCYGSFTDHPRHAYQFRPGSKNPGSLNTSGDFDRGVGLFLSCRNHFKNNRLYEIDAIEYSSQFMGIQADKLLMEFQKSGENNYVLLDSALVILKNIDRLLESHPNWKLQNWINFARATGETPQEQDYYESDARRLITTWGGWVNEYAARTWSGLIRDYYIPRWRIYYDSKQKSIPFDLPAWEEKWIHSSGISEIKPFEDPVETAYGFFEVLNIHE